MIEKIEHKDPLLEQIIDQINGYLAWARTIEKCPAIVKLLRLRL